MARLPQTLDRARHVELEGTRLESAVRTVALLVLAGVAAAGLANVFGERPAETAAAGHAAVLRVQAPTALRGGLVYQARVRVDAVRQLDEPALVLGPGWFDGMTLNSIEPEPARQSAREGSVALVFGRVRAGSRLIVRLQFQVNPTALGRRAQDVVLEDRGVPLVRVGRSILVFP